MKYSTLRGKAIANPNRPRDGEGGGIPNYYWADSLTNFLESRRRRTPSTIYHDKIAQAQNLAGLVYLPITFAATQLGRAKISIFEVNNDPADLDGRKKLPPADPIYNLFKRPNPNNTFRDILYSMSQMMDLHSEAFVWVPPVDSKTGKVSEFGEPLEMYVIPSAWITGLPPFSTTMADNGAYSVTPYITQSPGGYATTYIPAEQMIRIYDPHPLLDRAALSILQAISQTIDTVRSIDQSRISTMVNGCEQAVALELDPQWNNPNQMDMKKVREMWNRIYAGSRNANKAMILPPGVKATKISTKPDDMAWGEGWTQLSDFALACFQTNRAAVGMSGDLNYATLFASIKQVYWSKLTPRLEQFGQAFDKDLIHPYYGDDYNCELNTPPMHDDELKLKQLTLDLSCGAITYAQYLRERGYEIDVKTTPWLNDRAWSVKPPEISTTGEEIGTENIEGEGSLGGRKILEALERGLTRGTIRNGKH